MIDGIPPNGFETNSSSFRGGKNRGTAPDAVKPGGLQAGFSKFMDGRAGKAAKPKVDSIEIVLPTAERLRKDDTPGKTVGGTYRAVEAIERLRNGGKLDPSKLLNDGMYEAAQMLRHHFTESGLAGVRGPSLDSIRSGNGNGTAGFPAGERAMYHRQKFREAQSAMGWYIGAPYRGAGRLVVDVVCYDMPLKDASHIHIPAGRAEVVLAAGGDRLREGLFALATLWNCFGSTHSRMRAARDLMPGVAS